MSRKHFVSAAQIIKIEQDRIAARKMAELIIQMNENPNFDRERFLKACGF